MSKSLAITLTSLAITALALVASLRGQQQPEDDPGYCDGGTCCPAPSFPGYCCTLQSYTCAKGGNWCVQDCTWYCVPCPGS